MHKRDITIGFACLECNKVFKKHKYTQDKRCNWESVDYVSVCPQCSSAMYETGSAFKAPKVTDKKEWAKLKSLFDCGYKFNPDFGNPFKEPQVGKTVTSKVPESELKKQRERGEKMPNKRK